MFASHIYLWPLAAAAGGTVVSGLRCLALFIGLRLTLKKAPSADRLPIYREFARALSSKGPPRERLTRPPRERSRRQPRA
jgi:hypothetical protein